MATAKKIPEKKAQSQIGSGKGLWFFVLAVSLLLNAYFLGNKKDKVGQVLASVSGQTFRWRDVSESGKKALVALDGAYYDRLRMESEAWAEKLLLSKEAEERKVSVGDLIGAELKDKVQKPSQEEVNAVFARSPSADSKPYPQVLKMIESEIYSQRYAEARKNYIAGVFAKHKFDFKLKPPAGYEGQRKAASQFPVYVPPPASGTLDAKNTVVGPPSRGGAEAPVVVEVYSDFMCPFSKRFHGTLDAIQKKYPDKVRVVFRHFPLPFHQGAEVMAEASVCAQEQGKFWEYHDRLMTAEGGAKLDNASLEKLASELGLNTSSFSGCLTGRKYKTFVESDIASGKAQGISGTPGFLVNGRVSSGAQPVEKVGALIDWYLKPSGAYPDAKKPQPPAGAAAAPSGPRLDPNKVYELPKDWLEKGVSKGSSSAPVTLVEFFDYNCPFCKKGAEITDQLFEKNQGKIRVISKHFPLAMHPNAFKTSEALLCANEQGKFWEFRAQVLGESWGKSSPEDMKTIAKKTGLKESDFNACFDGSKMKARVDEDMTVGKSLGVTGTPAFFVNGTSVVGARPLEDFQKLVDEKSAAKKA